MQTKTIDLSTARRIGIKDARDRWEKQATGEVLFLDVRDPESFEHIHIKGATSLPLNHLMAHKDILPKDAEIITY